MVSIGNCQTTTRWIAGVASFKKGKGENHKTDISKDSQVNASGDSHCFNCGQDWDTGGNWERYCYLPRENSMLS